MTQTQILVVEDESIIAMEIREQLENLNYTVAAMATTGQEAIDQATATNPDLILMDIRLKGDMDGVTAAGHIKERFDIPLIFLTAYADETTLQRAKLTDPFGYILKPFATREIQTTIEVALYKHQIERKLKKNEERIRAVVETAPNAIISIDKQHNIISWNKGAEIIFGYSTDEALGRPLDFIMPARFRKVCRQGINRVISTGQLGTIKKTVGQVGLGKDGHEFPIEISLAAWQTEDGVFLTGIVRDITERKRVEEEIGLLQTITQAINETQDFHSALEVVLKKVCQTTNWDFGEVWLPSADNTILECGPVWYSNSITLEKFRKVSEEVTFLPAKGLPGRVWSSKQPEWLQDVSTEKEKVFHRVRVAQKVGLKAGFGLPIIANDQVVAVLVFFVSEPRREDGRLVNLISTMTTQIGSVIQRKQTEAEMRKLSNAIEQIADSVVITDREGVIEYVNPAFEQITGYTKKEAVGQTPRLLNSDRHPPKFFKDLWQTLLSGKVFRATFINKRKNGELYHDARTITSLKDSQDNITHFISTGRDVTERRLAYQALRESKDRLDEAQHIARLGSWERDIKTNELRWSDEMYHIFGLSAKDFQPSFKMFSMFVHPDDRAFVTRSNSDALNQKTPLNIDYRIVRSDGEIRYAHAQAKVVLDKNGQPTKMIGTTQDITERKLAETEREQRTAQLELINNIGSQIAAVLELDNLLNRTAHLVQKIFNYHYVALFLIEKDLLTLKAVAGSYKMHFSPDHTQPLSQGINGWVVTHGEKIVANDVSTEPRYTSLVEEHFITQAELCLPIKVADKTLGVLDIQSPQPNAFSDNDVMVMETLTSQIAAALENARLYAEARQHTQELTTLNMLIKFMASSLKQDIVLKQAMVGAKEMLDAEGASALLYDPVDDTLVFAAAASPQAEKMIGQHVPLKNSIAGQSMRDQVSILVEDVRLEPRFYNQIDALTRLNTRSLIAVPLIFQEEILGVIEAINKTNSTFNQHDLEILEALAGSAAIAIKNARLHAETERRAEQLTVLHELDQAITSSLHLSDIYHALAQHAARLLTYDRISIAILHGKEEARLAYVYGEKGTLPPIETILPLKSSVIGRVINQGQPMILHNPVDTPGPTQDESETNAKIHSSIVVPLRVKGEIIGTWNINSWQTASYSPDDLKIAQSMANQLAIAIENARLYKKEKEQLHHLQQSQTQLIQVEKMAALGRLVGSIAHEINNPIQAIQNCMSLLIEEIDEAQRPDKIALYADIAKDELARIAAIVRRMRDFYHPSRQGQPSLILDSDTVENFYLLTPDNLQNVDVHTILDNVLQLANKQLQHGNVKVDCRWAATLPAIQGRPDHLKQVFLNLTLNAIDAMSLNGGTLAVCTDVGQIELQAGQQKPAVKLGFSDTGEGISPEILPHLFEPLITTKEYGSGFGLYTSYKIIEAHQGQISVQSQLGEGTTFTILLPIAIDRAEI